MSGARIAELSLAVPGNSLGITQPTPWTAVTLINSWTATTGRAPQYRRDANGRVHLRGGVSGGGTLTNAAFTLPAGFRPSQLMQFAVPSNTPTAAFGSVDVATSGNVTPQIGNAAFVCFDGISFDAGA